MTLNPLLLRAAVFAALVAVPLPVGAQSQPAQLNVYSDNFSSGSTAAPGSAQRPARLAVDVADLDGLENRTTTLERRLQAHLADTGAHQPHGHPHSHGGGPASVGTNTRHDHSRFNELFGELLAQAIALLAPIAHAQQPPPLVVYTPDMSGPSSTAPSTPGSQLTAILDTRIPMLAQVDALLVRLNRELTAHVGNVNAHPHSHPHSHIPTPGTTPPIGGGTGVSTWRYSCPACDGYAPDAIFTTAIAVVIHYRLTRGATDHLNRTQYLDPNGNVVYIHIDMDPAHDHR